MAETDATNVITAIWAPGAVTANDATNLPANYPEIGKILGGLHITSTGGDYTGTTLTAIATTATPGSGNVSLVDGNSFRIGTACTTKTKLVLVYKALSATNPNKLITAMWLPDIVADDTDIDLPAYYPEIEEIIGGLQLAQSTDDLTSITLDGAVPTASLGAGDVSKTDGNTIKMGDANASPDIAILIYKAV